jgi:hypothetical protein
VSNTSLAAASIQGGGGPAVATVPVALFVITAAASVLPGAAAMRAAGRRPVVLGAIALGLAGACLELLAVYRAGFPLLAVGAAMQARPRRPASPRAGGGGPRRPLHPLGAAPGRPGGPGGRRRAAAPALFPARRAPVRTQGPAFFVGNNFRFIAAEFSPPAFKPRAVSLVVLCGVPAAVVGPEFARQAALALPPSGGFIVLIGQRGGGRARAPTLAHLVVHMCAQ